MKLNPIQTKLYNTAYKCLDNAANGNTTEAVKGFQEMFNLGKDNPAMLKLISNKAEREMLRHEVCDLGLIYGFYPLKRTFNYLKFGFNKQVKQINKEFSNLYNSLYPKTASMRDKLIKSGKVTLD